MHAIPDVLFWRFVFLLALLAALVLGATLVRVARRVRARAVVRDAAVENAVASRSSRHLALGHGSRAPRAVSV